MSYHIYGYDHMGFLIAPETLLLTHYVFLSFVKRASRLASDQRWTVFLGICYLGFNLHHHGTAMEGKGKGWDESVLLSASKLEEIARA